MAATLSITLEVKDYFKDFQVLSKQNRKKQLLRKTCILTKKIFNIQGTRTTTPQATLTPEFPLILLSGLDPRPKSSSLE